MITGFVPYFACETVGVSFPVIGFSAIDASFKLTPATHLCLGFLAVFVSMVAYEEYTGRMEGKMFAVYHYFLSPLIFWWQCQPTTSVIGTLFYMPPHLFTAWTLYLILKDDKLRRALNLLNCFIISFDSVHIMGLVHRNELVLRSS